MMKLAVSPEAINDIGEIKKYIRDELSNPKAANRIANMIKDSYKSLKQTPYIGRELSGYISVDTDYLFLVCENYYVFYKLEEDTIRIYRVIDGRRDFCRILFGIDLIDVIIEDIKKD